MSRETIERMIRSAYQARVAGDLDRMMGHFCEGACFALAGSMSASPIPVTCTGTAAIREALRRLSEGFAFSDLEILDLIIDGNKVAVRTRVRVRANASGQEAVTELLDVLRVEGERISSWTQFADTALAARLLGQ